MFYFFVFTAFFPCWLWQNIILAFSVPPNFVSVLFPCNCWWYFNESLWEHSILRGDLHNYHFFWQAGPSNSELYVLVSYALCIYRIRFIYKCSISWELLTKFQRNFVGIFNSEWRYAYHFHVLVRHSIQELWPLITCSYALFKQNKLCVYAFFQ